jgi:hypothetical protein
MTALSGVDLFIGIDDTDNLHSPGTGRRARALLDELGAAGFGTPVAATRHQLLVDDRIPYTTHNSSACLALRSPAGNPEAVISEVIEFCGGFLERVCPPEADPGLAVAVPSQLAETGSALVDFGRRAKREVLHTGQARRLAGEVGVHLSGHGGTHDGMIGALAAVGLHLSGNDGLFLTLPGIHELPENATIDDLCTLTPIDCARDSTHRRPTAGETIELGDWVRPVLLDGRAVLLLEPPREQPDGRRVWRTAPRYIVKQH